MDALSGGLPAKGQGQEGREEEECQHVVWEAIGLSCVCRFDETCHSPSEVKEEQKEKGVLLLPWRIEQLQNQKAEGVLKWMRDGILP